MQATSSPCQLSSQASFPYYDQFYVLLDILPRLYSWWLLQPCFYYLTDSKTLRIFREQYTTILPQQTYKQKKFEHNIYFQVSQSSFQSWKKNIFCIDIALCFIVVLKILTHKGASRDFHFLKMRVITWEKEGRTDLG